MLTPIDIQNHSLKTAVRGYSKKETDDFLEEIIKSYEEIYRENRELKDKLSSLSDGIQYYKGMESTLQKALVLAEKTSTETQEAAKSKAEAMTSEAETRAESMVKEAKANAEAIEKEANAYAEVTKSKAKQELEETRNHVRKLVQSYENYRLQFKKLAESQIEMLDSEHYSIFAPELDEMLEDAPNADEAMEAEETVAINAGISSHPEEELQENLPQPEMSHTNEEQETIAATSEKTGDAINKKTEEPTEAGSEDEMESKEETDIPEETKKSAEMDDSEKTETREEEASPFEFIDTE